MKISRKKSVKRALVAFTAVLQLGIFLVPQPSVTAAPARQMERLDRGVVAVKVTNGVFVSWRMFGTDPSGIAFNVYRNGTKVNGSPITGGTNYVDAGGTTSSTYTVKPVIGGQEQVASETANVWGQNYLDVPMSPPSSAYTANDCSAGDLDGDGEYDLVVKWEGASRDNSQAGVTDPVYLDGYKLNGTRLFRINLGKNIRADAHYTQFMVYDLDGDGKAEVACKTADGTVDGKGKVIGDATKDYRNSDGYILTGPEYLTVFSGQTGEALATANYDPPRGTVSSWGDGYGNRVDRFLACVAYLDGVRPSLVMQRGYYTRMVLAAWDFRDGKLTKRWTFDSNSSGNSDYAGQGNHNLSVGDVDGDGKDEIMQGAAAIDDNGTGMYTTKLGHGDAMHFGDLNPDRPGLEVWTCHEGSGGGDIHDARTGQILFRYNVEGDTGRACSADIVASSPGEEIWTSGSSLFSSTGQTLGSGPSSVNHAIWWDGDELRELLNGTSITKHGGGTLLSASGCASINGTKSNPSLQADILGDWREEAIFRTSDNTALRIYTTTNTTNRRIYTLMHDPIYRLGIAWQNVAYNQPPHTGFFIGAGMKEPPVPGIYLTGTNPTPPPTTPPTNTPTPTRPPTTPPTATPTSIPVPGTPEDLNGDNAVNMADIMMVAAYFNTPVNDSNKKFDLTKDGAINMADIMQVASKFNTILVPVSTVYEAEQATISNGIQETVNTGYTGSGYVNYDNAVGGFVEWTVNVATAGTYTLNFRYANGTTVNRPLEVKVNNNIAAGSLAFNATGAWTTWSNASITANLNAGNNIIRATALTVDGGPNIDNLQVSK